MDACVTVCQGYLLGWGKCVLGGGSKPYPRFSSSRRGEAKLGFIWAGKTHNEPALLRQGGQSCR